MGVEGGEVEEGGDAPVVVGGGRPGGVGVEGSSRVAGVPLHGAVVGVHLVGEVAPVPDLGTVEGRGSTLGPGVACRHTRWV